MHNPFLEELQQRKDHQVAYSLAPMGDHTEAFAVGARGRQVFLTAHDKVDAEKLVAEGFTNPMRTPVVLSFL